MKPFVASWAYAVALATLLGCGNTGSTGGSVADATSGDDEGNASSEAGSSSGSMDGADDQTSGDGADATLDGTSGDATDSSSTDATIDQGLDAGADATLDGSGALDGSADAPGSDGAAVSDADVARGCPLADAAWVFDATSPLSDASLDSPRDATADAPPVGVDIYVSPSGNDSHAGTALAPVQTIEKAASLAQAGDRILLLDGLYDATTQPAFQDVVTANPISLSDGVRVSAVNQGMVTLRGWGSDIAFVLAGSATFTGLKFEQFGTAIQATTGTLLVSGTTFSKCGQGGAGVAGALDLQGTVNATVTPGGVSNYLVPPSYGFALLQYNTHLTVSGGTLEGTTTIGNAGSAAFAVLGGASLTLDGVTVVSGGTPVAVDDQGAVTIQNGSVIRGFSTSAVNVFENDILNVIGSTLEQNGIGVKIQNSGLNSRVGAYVTLDQAIVSNNLGNGIESDPGAILLSLTVNDSLIQDNQANGILLGDAASLVATSSAIRYNHGYGLDLVPTSGPQSYFYSITMRGTQVTGNQSAGVSISGWASLTPGFDLGKVGSPGGNTFTCNNTSGTPGMANMVVPSSPIASVYAVGNTWAPSVQGADASGHYSVSGAGATLDVSSGSGTNYAVTSSTLRLAQNP